MNTYAPKYHIFAGVGGGWINDPNGLIYAFGRYHVFFQHYPYSPKWGPMHWGHVSSADLAHWTREPIALKPNPEYEHGCFSGSAVEQGGKMMLIYTSHDPRRTNKEVQCVAESVDGGKAFMKYAGNPVISAAPAGFSDEFRDPKVFRIDDEWRMVVGCKKDERGCALQYASSDLLSWEYRGVLVISDGVLGNMWECPNYCNVDGQDILIVSPMDMEGHKNIAIFGQYDSSRMTIDHVQEIDLGDNFYASQVFSDGNRTLLFAWVTERGDPYPSTAEGWAGSLTIPRVLHVQNGRLLQEPAPELSALRLHPLELDAQNIEFTSDAAELRAQIDGEFAFTVSDSKGVLFTLCKEGDRVFMVFPSGRRVESDIPVLGKADLIVYIDRCIVECFVNGIAFTERMYPHDYAFHCKLDGEILSAKAYALADAFESQTLADS